MLPEVVQAAWKFFGRLPSDYHVPTTVSTPNSHGLPIILLKQLDVAVYYGHRGIRMSVWWQVLLLHSDNVETRSALVPVLRIQFQGRGVDPEFRRRTWE